MPTEREKSVRLCLKKILEVDECELKQYWDRYEPLKREIPLLEKLLGHKEKRSRRHIDMLPVVSIPRNNCFGDSGEY